MSLGGVAHSNPLICPCVRLYLVDPAIDPPFRQETPVEEVDSHGTIVRTVRCPEHQIADVHEHTRVMLAEGQLYAAAELVLLKSHPELTARDEKGEPVAGVADSAKVALRFNAKRELEIIAPSLSKDEKNALNAATPDTVSVR